MQTDRPTDLHPYIYTSIHPCIHASMHPRIHVSTHQYIHTSIHPSIHTSIHPHIHPSIHIYMLFVFYIHMHMFTPSIIIYPHYGPKISSMLSRAIVGLYQRPLDGGSTADFGTHEPWPGNPNHGDQQSQRNVSETSSYNHICIFIYIPGKKKPSYGTDSFIDYLPINWFFIAILKYQIVYIYIYMYSTSADICGMLPTMTGHPNANLPFFWELKCPIKMVTDWGWLEP